MDKISSSPISIYALGGLGEVGKNMYCIEDDDSIIIIDCGVRFPSADLPGIDYIVPDFTHLKNNRNKIKALIITHGHEDHIGGIPFLIQQINVPAIYAPKLALELINSKFEESKFKGMAHLLEYSEDTKLTIAGKFNISFFRVTHSIPDSFGVVVDTPEGRIVSTGDFKIDLTPIGPDINLVRMTKLGTEGIDLLLSDSTNAEIEGYTPSEKNVFDSIADVFQNAPGRLIISTFSSNISRIQQICEVAVMSNRRIAIIGRSMEKAVEIARKFGYVKVPDAFIIPSSDIKLFKNNELVVLCTGSQGEPMAALSRIAGGEHKDLHIIPGDTVVFSSSAIPGNGIMIDHVVNVLTRAGADVVTNSILSDIHSSGHPSRQELRLLLKLMKPKYFMPMHGEHRMLRLHAELAQTLGIPKENTFIMDNGETLILSHHKVTRGYDVEHGATYIDGKDLNGLADTVMKDRKVLFDDGMLVITATIDAKNSILIGDIQLYGKGLINQDHNSLYTECKDNISNAIQAQLKKKTNFNELKVVIKTVATAFFERKTNRQPMIIPVILNQVE